MIYYITTTLSGGRQMVVFENTSKSFGNNLVIQNLNLSIPRGQFAVLIGPSGCGKTTSLRMINRLIEPTDGTVFVDGQDVSKVNPVDLRRGIGYVIQQIGLFPNMTIEQNIEVVPKLLGWPKERRRERVTELLEMVEMSPAQYRGRYPSELSGGQQQRVGVLRALAVSPPLLLMDEPFGALDPITRETLQDELKKLQTDLGITIVFVTHDIDEAVKLADVIVLMKDGKVVQAAPPEEILANPADDFVREFIGKKRLKVNYDVDLVREIMNSRVFTITGDKGFAESITLMKQRNVDSLIVTDSEGVLKGVIPVELLREVAGTKVINTIGEIEPLKVTTINMNAQAREAFDTILAERLPYLIVVDGKNRVRGLVTKTSLVKSLAGVVWGEAADD